MMSHRAVTALILAASFSLLMALAISTARNVVRGDSLALAQAELTVTRAANVAQSLLDRHLLQVDGQLDSLSEWLVQGFFDAADPERASRALEQLTAHSYTHRNLMLADAHGGVWASANGARRGHSLPLPREVMARALRYGGSSLHGPLPGPEPGQSLLIILRRVGQDAAGQDVLAAAEIPTGLITAILAPMVTPPELRVRLENSDGLILAAAPGQIHLVGQALAPLNPQVRRAIRVERTPDRQGVGDVFATARPVMFSGLLAVAALPERAALAGWPRLRLSILVSSSITALLLVLLAAAIFFATWNRQRAVEEREAANTRLRAAIEGLPDGFVLWDAHDRLSMCNSRYRDFLAPIQHILVPGTPFRDVAHAVVEHGIMAPDEHGAEGRLERVIELHFSQTNQMERQMADGRRLRIARQRMPDGGLVVVATDITLLNRAMLASAQARDSADRAMRAKANLLAHVSHELRAPLAGLQRLADALKHEPSLQAPQRHQAGLIGATARHLLALANEVLDLAAMDADSLTLKLDPASPAAIVAEALAMAQPLAEARQVRLRHTMARLPPLLQLDATRLRQMLLNLLANAAKFTPHGSEVHLHATAQDGSLRFSVRDQGPGVPEAEREQLFQDFTRLASAEVEGTGLGLSITARLAALMGGQIGCTDAEPGPGGCFWVEIPLLPPCPAAPQDARLDHPSTARPLRLLAVDDAPSNLAVLRAMLANTVYELETVSEGAAALEAVEIAAREDRPFDAVLMDVMMPGMDGRETTRRLRAMPGLVGRMPVIAVTASAFPEDIAETRAAGMLRHVTKPVDRVLLLRTLAELLNPSAGTAGDADPVDALRPMLMAELERQLNQLRLDLDGGGARIVTVHALASAVGHVGQAHHVARARRVLRALRDAEPDAHRLARALLEELRHAFPEKVSLGADWGH